MYIFLLPVIIFIAILTIMRPYWGLCFFMAMIPFEGLLASGPFLSFNKFYGIFLALCSLLIMLRRVNVFSYDNLPARYLLFIFWSFISILWAHQISPNLIKNSTYLSLFILYLVIILLPEENNGILHLKFFVLSTFLSTLTIPFFAKEIFLNDPYARLSSGGLNPNDYAGVIAIAIPFAFMWFQLERKKWLKIIPILFIPVGILAIAFTQTRTGTLALLPFVVYLAIFSRRTGLSKRFIIFLVFGISIYLLAYFAPAEYFSRLSVVFDIEGSDRFSHRLDIWQAGWNMFLSRPFLGVGTGNFHLFSPIFSDILLEEGALVAHNIFISVLGELGIIGLIIFLFLIYGHFRRNLWLIFKGQQNQETKIIASTLLVVFIAYLIIGMGMNWEYRKILPLILGNIVLLSRKRKK